MISAALLALLLVATEAAQATGPSAPCPAAAEPLEPCEQTPPFEEVAKDVAHQFTGSIAELRALICSLERQPPSKRRDWELGQAYSWLAQAYLIVRTAEGEDQEDFIEDLREQLARIYAERAFGYDPLIRPEADKNLSDKQRGLLKGAKKDAGRAACAKQAEVQREEALLAKLAAAEEKSRRQADEIGKLKAAVTEKDSGLRLVTAVGGALAAPQIRDRDGNDRILRTLLLFVGAVAYRAQPADATVSFGLAEGMGVAPNTPASFVIGPGLRVEVWRIGLTAGYGWRLSTPDRRRHARGVALGLTYRIFTFRPKWGK